MNKKGQGEWWVILWIFVIIVIFISFFYVFETITITKLSFNINNGKILNTSSIEEYSTSRLTSWFETIDKGYYDVYLSSVTPPNNFNRLIQKTGNMNKVVYFNQFLNCINITISNSITKEILDSKQICKMR